MTDASSLLSRAVALADDGALDDAAAACEQAIAVWPDIGDAYRLRFQLACKLGDRDRVMAALRHLQRHDVEDADSAILLGTMLGEDGDWQRVASVLRSVATRDHGHGGAVALLAASLAHTGALAELRALQPLLDRAAPDAAVPYPPYAPLAMARLAATVDQPRWLDEFDALQRSPRWLDAGAALSALAGAIARGAPFSLLRVDPALARLLSMQGRNAARLLRPAERLAVLEQDWPGWFGGTVAEPAAMEAAGSLGAALLAAIEQADIVAMPDGGRLRAEPARFGFMAEAGRLIRIGSDARFGADTLPEAMHETVPYLRTALAGLPFLGFVGAHPAMFRKLAHFCGVSDTAFVPVPRAAVHPVPEDGIDPRGFLPNGHAAVLEAIAVPRRGAVFLVSAPGPLGPIYAGRIRALGGIAIDIGPLAARWAG